MIFWPLIPTGPSGGEKATTAEIVIVPPQPPASLTGGAGTETITIFDDLAVLIHLPILISAGAGVDVGFGAGLHSQ